MCIQSVPCVVRRSKMGDQAVHVVNGDKSEIQQFIEVHKPQLASCGVPEWLWETLFYKLKHDVYDAGEVFTYIKEEEPEDEEANEEDEEDNDSEQSKDKLKVAVVKEEGLLCADPNNIYLIDHAWTHRTPEQARQQLTQIPSLLQRMMGLMSIKEESGKTADDHVDSVLREMWRYNQTYSIQIPGLSAEDKQPIWYVLDEFGSLIHHSDAPSCALVPFLYIKGTEQMAFSLLFVLRDLEYGEEVTRDYAHRIDDPLHREIHLLPWQPADLTHLPTDQEEPDENYMNRVCNETPPDVDAGDRVETELNSAAVKEQGPLKVYTLDVQIKENLKHPNFVFVDSYEEADIVWLKEAWTDFTTLKTVNKYVNQFPGEKLVISKDLLAVSGRRIAQTDATRSGARWLPVTFSLDRALPQFVSYFQQQEKRGKPNVWIIKPFNFARSLDTTVSNNLNQIVRLTETTIPKVACEYITDPVLFNRSGVGPVKFDLRFIVLLQSVKPLKLFAYKIFWIRFANKPFSLDHFDDFEKHFTVMNYAEDGTDWHQMLWKDFAPAFDSQFPGYTWESTERSLHISIKELFEAAASKPHPFGLTHSPKSRAMYGIDAMLQWETDDKGDKYMQPMLLECNYLPDCERACWHRKEYFDDVFSTLFLDDIKDRPVVLL